MKGIGSDLRHVYKEDPYPFWILFAILLFLIFAYLGDFLAGCMIT